MEHVEYVYTFGMDDEEVERHLREAMTGVLSLARDDDARHDFALRVHGFGRGCRGALFRLTGFAKGGPGLYVTPILPEARDP